MEAMGAKTDQRRGGSAEHVGADRVSAPHLRVGYGYVNEHFMMGYSELAAARRDIAACAVAAGCHLAAIFVERIETSPAAWRALHLKLIASSDSNALILPGLHHLANVGSPVEVRNSLLDSGMNVLIAPTRSSTGVTTGATPVPQR